MNAHLYRKLNAVDLCNCWSNFSLKRQKWQMCSKYRKPFSSLSKSNGWKSRRCTQTLCQTLWQKPSKQMFWENESTPINYESNSVDRVRYGSKNNLQSTTFKWHFQALSRIRFSLLFNVVVFFFYFWVTCAEYEFMDYLSNVQMFSKVSDSKWVVNVIWKCSVKQSESLIRPQRLCNHKSIDISEKFSITN